MKRAKHIRRTISLIVTLALLAAVFVFPAAAAEFDTANATYFYFSNSGIDAAEGAYTGYSVDGTALTINAEGTYIVSGVCTDGSIKIKSN